MILLHGASMLTLVLGIVFASNAERRLSDI